MGRSGVQPVAVDVTVLAASEDAEDTGADRFQGTMHREVGIAGVVEGIGEGQGQGDALVELADGEQPGVAGKLASGGLDDEWRAAEVQDLGPGGWYTHRRSP